MAITGNGTSAYAASAGTLAPLSSSYTYAFWYYALSAAANTTAKHPFSLTDSTEAFDLNFAWNHPNAGAYKGAFHRGNDTFYYFLQHPGTPAHLEWHHWAVTFSAGTLRLYYDGAQVASTSAVAATGLVNPNVTVLSYKSGAAGFDDGSVADLCIWSTALTAAEIFSIAFGVAPNGVQPGSVVQCTPLNADADTVTGQSLTNHSGVYNGTYFTGMNGGIAMTGANVFSTGFGCAPSGGIAIGSNTTNGATYTWPPAGGIAVTSQMPLTANYHYLPTGGVAMTSDTLIAAVYTWSVDGTIVLSGAFRSQQSTASAAVIRADGRAEADTTRH